MVEPAERHPNRLRDRAYQREPTRLAPASLKVIHPLGAVIRDDGIVMAESAAIVEYLVGKYDKKGKLAPPVDPADGVAGHKPLTRSVSPQILWYAGT